MEKKFPRQRAYTYSQNFYNPNLNEKNVQLKGEKDTSRQLSGLPERREQNFWSTSHISVDSCEQICPFSNSGVHWQDCRGQIPQPGMWGFKTSSKSLPKPTLSSSLENAELAEPAGVSGCSSNSPVCHPGSMAPSAFSHFNHLHHPHTKGNLYFHQVLSNRELPFCI